MAESTEAMALLGKARAVILELQSDLRSVAEDPVNVYWIRESNEERRLVGHWIDDHDDLLARHEIEAAKAKRQKVAS